MASASVNHVGSHKSGRIGNVAAAKTAKVFQCFGSRLLSRKHFTRKCLWYVKESTAKLPRGQGGPIGQSQH